MSSATQVPSLAQQPTSIHQKLGAHQWFESIGSPRYVVAPMVDQSELAWRVLSRLHGATIAYTPMFHAGLFGSPDHPRYCHEAFDTSPDSLEGIGPFDRPLIVQFCANDKDKWLAAAEKVVGRCDAVDLNLGCPQGIAKKGNYGAFLMDEWELIGNMISHLHTNLPIPISVKCRIFPSLTKTLEYATHLFKSGAQLLTVHGRTRESKGQLAGLASWPTIASVASLLSPIVPVYANGGLPSGENIEACLEETGTKGVMSAEGNLYNPMIFSPVNAEGGVQYRKCLPEAMRVALDECEKGLLSSASPVASTSSTRVVGPAYAPATYLAAQYLSIVLTLPSTETSPSAIKAHIFKLFRPIWATGKHFELREALGRANVRGTRLDRHNCYRAVVTAMEEKIKIDLESGELPADSHRLLTHAEVVTNYDSIIPYSHAQPYYRIAPVIDPSASIEGVSSLSERVAEVKRVRESSVENPEESTLIEVKKAKLAHSLDASPPVTASPTPDIINRVLRPPNASTLPCAGSTTALPCPNTPASRCPMGACKGCCAGLFALSSLASDPSQVVEAAAEETAEGTKQYTARAIACEIHEERAKKEQERNARKRKGAKARRAEVKGLTKVLLKGAAVVEPVVDDGL